MNKRQTKLLSFVNEKERVEVVRLSEVLGVSQVTIRKDLKELEEMGLIKRKHGYAVRVKSYDVHNRLAFDYELKNRIAAEALKYITDGETVMIQSGASCALLGEKMGQCRSEVGIITNSTFIADYLRKYPALRLMLLGGEYQHESQNMVGPLTVQSVQNFFVDKFFTGVDGYSIDRGFTSDDLMRADTARAMAKRARRIFILTESGKFSQNGVVTMFPVEMVDTVITDEKIPQETLTYLKDHGVTVVCVPVD